MGASEFVQLLNEPTPSIILLEIVSEVDFEMLNGKRKRKTKSITNNDFCLFLLGAPLVVLNGVTCSAQRLQILFVSITELDAANILQTRYRGIDGNCTSIKARVLVHVLQQESIVHSSKPLFQ